MSISQGPYVARKRPINVHFEVVLLVGINGTPARSKPLVFDSFFSVRPLIHGK